MKKRVKDLEARQPELSQKDKKLTALFDRFKAAGSEQEKYKAWKELAVLFDKDPGVRYTPPEGTELTTWRNFVRYGYSHPLRMKELDL